MFRILVLILILVPAIEIWGIVAVGRGLGWELTILLIIATGLAGAWLARKQGLQVFQLAQLQLNQGRLPGEAILDGICIFAGGLVLLTPGFFTDAMGFLLLIPYTRGIVKLWIKRWLRKMVESGRIM
ncbi:MAG: membrane protein FxsA [Bacillaceae bacterium]|nr:membrane protein FxsA [Bacillaceae bacterium]